MQCISRNSLTQTPIHSLRWRQIATLIMQPIIRHRFLFLIEIISKHYIFKTHTYDRQFRKRQGRAAYRKIRNSKAKQLNKLKTYYEIYDCNKKLICRVQNPDIPRAGRLAAHGGVAGRGRAGLGANRIVRLGHEPPSYRPKHRRHVA